MDRAVLGHVRPPLGGQIRAVEPPLLHCEPHDVPTVTELELLQHVVDVMFDCADFHKQQLGYLLVCTLFRNVSKNLKLPHGERNLCPDAGLGTTPPIRQTLEYACGHLW